MKISPPQERLSGNYLEGMINASAKVAKALHISLQQLFVSLATQGEDAVLPILAQVLLDERGRKNETLGAVGSSVFRGSKLVGRLLPKEQRGYFWLKRKFEDPQVVVLPNKGRWACVEIVKPATKIKPKIQGQKVSIDVNITAKILRCADLKLP